MNKFENFGSGLSNQENILENKLEKPSSKKKKLKRALMSITAGVMFFSNAEMAFGQDKQEKYNEPQEQEFIDQTQENYLEEQKKLADSFVRILCERDSSSVEYLGLHEEIPNVFRYKVFDKNGQEVGIFNLMYDKYEKATYWIEEIEKTDFKLEISSEAKEIMSETGIRMEGKILYLDNDPHNESINLNEDGSTEEIIITEGRGGIIRLLCINKDGGKQVVYIENGAIGAIK